MQRKAEETSYAACSGTNGTILAGIITAYLQSSVAIPTRR